MKKVRLRLEGLNGNAFNLLGTFQVAARFQGWSDEEIKAVADEATAGDYDHLLRVLMTHTTDPQDDDDQTDGDGMNLVLHDPDNRVFDAFRRYSSSEGSKGGITPIRKSAK